MSLPASIFPPLIEVAVRPASWPTRDTASWFASAVVHVAALSALNWTLGSILVRPTLPGKPQVITLQLEAVDAPREAEQLAPPRLETPVIVTPEAVTIAEHKFVPVATSLSDPLLDMPAASLAANTVTAVEARPSERVGPVTDLGRIPDVKRAVPPVPMQRRETAEMVVAEPAAAVAPSAIPTPARRTSDVGPPVPQTAALPEFAGQDETVRPVALDTRPPMFPDAARVARLTGSVRLSVAVTASGGVAEARVLDSSGHAILDGAAQRAVRMWRFRPATQGGEPIPFTITVRINFERP